MNYLIPGDVAEELPGEEEAVVTVKMDEDLDDTEVLCTSTNPLGSTPELLLCNFPFPIAEVEE